MQQATAGISDPMVPEPYRIRRVRRETYDTFTLELEPARGGDAVRFAPGQSTMLYVFGVGEVPISICGDPARRDLLVQTVRAVGTVTRALTACKRGDLVGVRGPFGSTWPVEEAVGHDVLIIPGGIGLPPLRPAIYRLLAERGRYGNISLLYGARTPDDLVYRREVERWRGRLDFDVAVTVDRATAEWRGNVGVVTTLITRARFDPARTVAMICGPEVMMRFAALELQDRGVPPSQIYVSMERNMKCFIGFCGHCQFGPTFVCRDGPVFPFDRLAGLLATREV
jgi:NAD(P)H-flavin reductase